MKKLFLILLLSSFIFNLKAQDTSVENSTFGIQTGFLGFWVHNEIKLSNTIALRTELGLEGQIYKIGRNENNTANYILAPVLTLEPRWYYNLNKRANKSKNTEGNSGNFLSLKTSYYPDWFMISNDEGLLLTNQIFAIPTWGIRRNLGKHFMYETGIGLGYAYYFTKKNGYEENESGAAINLHLRIGYRF